MTARDSKKPLEEVLLEHALEFILEAPEDQLLQLLKDSGEDPVELAREGRNAIDAALKRYGQEKLGAARREHSTRTEDLVRVRQGHPEYSIDKLSLLKELIEQARLAGQKVSFQNRNLKDLAAEDLDKAILYLRTLLKRNERK
jgi:hypothetical protein